MGEGIKEEGRKIEEKGTTRVSFPGPIINSCHWRVQWLYQFFRMNQVTWGFLMSFLPASKELRRKWNFFPRNA